MTSDSIVVTWAPPGEPNGHILKYSVYIHPLRPGAQVKYYLFRYSAGCNTRMCTESNKLNALTIGNYGLDSTGR